MRQRIGAAIVVLVAAAAAGCTATPSAPSAPPTTRGPAAASSHPTGPPAPISIDREAGELFRPLAGRPPGDVLTAQQAWARWVAHVGGTQRTVPPGLTVRLGHLTLLPNVHYRLSYSYSAVSTCVSRALKPTINRHCTEWTFLDARSGREIDETTQPGRQR